MLPKCSLSMIQKGLMLTQDAGYAPEHTTMHALDARQSEPHQLASLPHYGGQTRASELPRANVLSLGTVRYRSEKNEQSSPLDALLLRVQTAAETLSELSRFQ